MFRYIRQRLCFEALERRDLLTVLRVAAWNTFNNPNNVAADADFSTVLSAIGSETVAGNTKRIDILALQETDPPGSGGNSIGRIADVLDSLYTSTNYESFVSSPDGGGDSTGFIYDTSTVSLLQISNVSPSSLTHSIIRGKFRPIDTVGDNDFFVYTVHLKSGSTASDETIRGTEANLLRNDADLLGEGAAVLFVGDFNMQDSFEVAHTNLTANGASQVQDVANAPGDWLDNIAFKSLHSQNPQNNLNDRFDLHFASGEFFDGIGIEYVDNSFHVFGNNGSHTLNDAITTGTGAAPNVLTALANASDHLPVVADYEIIESAPFVRISETGDSTKVIEGGLYDTYQVVLNTVPTANVTVTASPDSQVDLGLTNELVFTPANALTPQTILVNAMDDATGEGDHSGLISHVVASADTDYDGISVASVAVEIIDDDDPKFVINEIDADTEGVDVLEFVELYDGGVGNSSLEDKKLVFFDGSTDTVYLSFSWTGNNPTNSEGFYVVGNSNVPNVDFAFSSSNRFQNGPDAVALYDNTNDAAPSFGDPVTTVGLLDAVVYGTDDAPDLGLLALLQPGQPQLNENATGNKDFESLSRFVDGGTPRTSSFTTRPPTPGQRNVTPASGVLILQSGTRVDVIEDGANDSYLLALDTIPSAPVTITVDPDDQTDLGAGVGVAIDLLFTSANALIPQAVVVTANDDADVEGEHVSVITHTTSSTDLTYDGITVGSVVANVIDNEIAVVPNVVISEIMYNPDSEESEPGIAEWIEIVNVSAAPIDISDWRFDDEDSTSWAPFPTATTLDPYQVAIFFDEQFTDAATFREEWSVPLNALVVGIGWAGLANGPSDTNELLELLDISSNQIDFVNFDNMDPWPSLNPDGPSIYLTELLADNNEGTNWARSLEGTDFAFPASGATFSTSDVASPGIAPLLADFDRDGDVDGADFLDWQRGFGVPTASRSDGDADSDQDVDAVDLAIWDAMFGSTNSRLAASDSDFDGDGDIDGADFLSWQRGLGLLTAAKSDGDADNDLDVDADDLRVWESAFGEVASASAVVALKGDLANHGFLATFLEPVTDEDDLEQPSVETLSPNEQAFENLVSLDLWRDYRDADEFTLATSYERDSEKVDFWIRDTVGKSLEQIFG